MMMMTLGKENVDSINLIPKYDDNPGKEKVDTNTKLSHIKQGLLNGEKADTDKKTQVDLDKNSDELFSW